MLKLIRIYFNIYWIQITKPNIFLLQNQNLEDSPAPNVHLLDETLFINSWTDDDNGDYRCEVTNQAGTSQSNSVKLSVAGRNTNTNYNTQLRINRNQLNVYSSLSYFSSVYYNGKTFQLLQTVLEMWQRLLLFMRARICSLSVRCPGCWAVTLPSTGSSPPMTLLVTTPQSRLPITT